MPRHKSDVYISGRTLGNSVKVSLHEPGPSRFALTNEWIKRTHFQAPEGKDQRLAIEWEHPRPHPPRLFARPFSIIVPYDEVLDRKMPETGQVIWVPPPPEGTSIHFDVVYTHPSLVVTNHPGARSMGTKCVGEVQLENEERVFVTWLIRPMDEAARRLVEKLRSGRIADARGNPIDGDRILAFGKDPNPDANDGTYVGKFLDVTRK